MAFHISHLYIIYIYIFLDLPRHAEWMIRGAYTKFCLRVQMKDAGIYIYIYDYICMYVRVCIYTWTFQRRQTQWMGVHLPFRASKGRQDLKKKTAQGGPKFQSINGSNFYMSTGLFPKKTCNFHIFKTPEERVAKACKSGLTQVKHHQIPLSMRGP